MLDMGSQEAQSVWLLGCSSAVTRTTGPSSSVAPHPAVGWRHQYLPSPVLMGQLASPRASDLRESQEETAMSFMI